jgi:flagellar biosynthetic protein FliP
MSRVPVAVRAALALALVAALPALGAAQAAPVPPQPPVLSIQLSGGSGSWSPALNIAFLLTLLTVLPALLVSVTSFSRIIISLHFLRQALGTQTAPSNQTLIGLSLFLTWFVMAPVLTQVRADALDPLLQGQIDGPAALELAWPPLRDFMLRNTRNGELALFQELAKAPPAATAAEVDPRVLVPAFMISEIKTAFQIGILLYLPFLMIELIVSSVLLALGMLQLPPIVVSTPIKLVLFVVVDGWGLVIGSLVRSVH